MHKELGRDKVISQKQERFGERDMSGRQDRVEHRMTRFCMKRERQVGVKGLL